MKEKNDSEKLVIAASNLFSDIVDPELEPVKEKLEKQKQLILVNEKKDESR